MIIHSTVTLLDCYKIMDGVSCVLFWYKTQHIFIPWCAELMEIGSKRPGGSPDVKWSTLPVHYGTNTKW